MLLLDDLAAVLLAIVVVSLNLVFDRVYQHFIELNSIACIQLLVLDQDYQHIYIMNNVLACINCLSGIIRVLLQHRYHE